MKILLKTCLIPGTYFTNSVIGSGGENRKTGGPFFPTHFSRPANFELWRRQASPEVKGMC